jgi:hypothetical protein
MAPVGAALDGAALDVSGKIIFRWILERYCGVLWIRWIWLRIETSRRLL